MVRSSDNIAQAKLLRVLKMAIFLMRGHRTVEEMSAKFNCSERTAYRYLNLIDEMDFGLEQDFNKRFYIVDFDDCPLCGAKHKSQGTQIGKDVHPLVHSQPGFLN